MAAGGVAGPEQPLLESFTPKNHNRLRFVGIKEHRASIKGPAALPEQCPGRRLLVEDDELEGAEA
jgi:hypothetical protein